MRRPPGRRDEAIARVDRDRGVAVAGEGDLDRVEEPVETGVALDLLAPVGGQRRRRIDGHDPRSQPLLGELAGEVELGDVAAEEVAELDRRQQQVDALRLGWAHGQLERLDGPGEHERPLVIDPGDVLGHVLARLLLGQPRVVGQSRDRPRMEGSERRDAAAPEQAVGDDPLGPHRLGHPDPVAQAAKLEPGEGERRALGGGEAAEDAAGPDRSRPGSIRSSSVAARTRRRQNALK